MDTSFLSPYACLLAGAAGACASLAAAYLHFTEPEFIPTVPLPDEDDDADIYPLNPDTMTDEELKREIFLSRGGRLKPSSR